MCVAWSRNYEETIMRWCRKCVYPEAAVNLVVDDVGVCSACRVQEELDQLTPKFWRERERKFMEIVDWAKSRANSYDCIVPVSGGKDSYFQVHIAKKYGLNPLLVTYHGNNYLPEGEKNLRQMREVFDVDHLIVGPSINTLVRLNRLGFHIMGDMNWHAHAGIKIVPLQIAIGLKIPLMLWGEITWSISGMFSPDDYVQYNKRSVLEHDCRGYEWHHMLEESEGLSAGDLNWLRFPSDSDIDRVGVKGIYVGNFFPWDPNEHVRLVTQRYGWEPARQPFERTYRTMSNLDDMHENGIHDYLKFIKFGYGRASDHASKDVRSGYISRDEAVSLVREYDHVKPRRDLERWLQYTGVTEDEFDRVADSFRDSRVWRREGGSWVKDDIWGGSSSYGRTHQ